MLNTLLDGARGLRITKERGIKFNYPVLSFVVSV